MLPIRRFILRELAVILGAILLVMLTLAWVGLERAFETGAPFGTEAERNQAERVRLAQLKLLAGFGVLLLAFAVWRVHRLVRQFGDQLEALARSASTLREGRIPERVPSDVQEIGALSDVLRTAAETCQRESELKLQLERSQRFESMGMQAGGIAHEVNRQLVAILGQINFSKELLPKGHAALRRLSKAEDAVERCSQMIKPLLGLTHRVPPRLRSLDVNTSVVNTAPRLERVLGELIRIELSLAPDLPPVLGEPVQLEQVLLSLGENARDAMPQGGRLELSTRRAGSQHILLLVRDTGTGIPTEVLPRIFEPFFTTKGVRQGSDLGLAMVRSILEAHGGTIDVESWPGAGTEFRIRLLIHDEATPTVEGGAGAVPEPRTFVGKRILVAEDDPNLRELLAEAFTQALAQVDTAPDGLAAWTLFQRSRYDLVITDQRMPECTGVELLGRIRTSGSGVPVILASGYGFEGLQGELTKDPRLRFFQKPFSIRSLFAAAWDLLHAASSSSLKSDP